MKMFRFLTAGESHGSSLASIVEGMVAGLPLGEEDIDSDLKRRQAGYGRSHRMQIEQDHAEIISGVRHGLTLGSPICLLIRNREWENWKEVMSISSSSKQIEPVTRLRPGHADLAGIMKYGFNDIRPILERSSARETAARVAAGAIARRFLKEFDIEIHSHTLTIGGREAMEDEPTDWQRVESSPVRCADPEAEKEMMLLIDKAGAAGDSLGGIFEVVAQEVPVGLGSHVQWDRKLSGRIAQAVMSINAVKGVEIGIGFATAKLRGSQVQDVIELSSGQKRKYYHTTNHAGGIEGGMSNGESIIVRAAVKPIATMSKPLPSIDIGTGEKAEAHYERSDICVVPAAGVIGEAMLAIVLADAMLEKFGGDSLEETLHNCRAYLDSCLSQK